MISGIAKLKLSLLPHDKWLPLSSNARLERAHTKGRVEHADPARKMRGFVNLTGFALSEKSKFMLEFEYPVPVGA
jgi:hypothetical protein